MNIKILIALFLFITSSIICGDDAQNNEPLPEELQYVEETRELKLAFTGDIMCHQWQLKGAYTGKGYDFSQSFSEISWEIDNADFTIGNFETTLAGKEKIYRHYPTFNTPDSFAEAAKNAGFDMFMTANNHSLDSGTFGIKRTLDKLDELNIMHAGSYRNEEEAKGIQRIEINGISAAILNYTYGTNGFKLPKDKKYMLDYIDYAKIKSDLETALDTGSDEIIVFLHFGNEYQLKPSAEQKKLVEFIHSNGADIVIGSHPHVLQPFEIKKDRISEEFTAFSLGNFISSQRTVPRDVGVILYITLEKRGNLTSEIKEVSFIPTVVLDNKRKNGIHDLKIVNAAVSENSRAKEASKWAQKLLSGRENNRMNENGEYIFYTKSK